MASKWKGAPSSSGFRPSKLGCRQVGPVALTGPSPQGTVLCGGRLSGSCDGWLLVSSCRSPQALFPAHRWWDSSRHRLPGWVRQPERGAQAWGGGWGQGRREGLAQAGALPQLAGPSRSFSSKNHTSTSGSIPAVFPFQVTSFLGQRCQ